MQDNATTLQMLENDPVKAVKFVIDNNPAGVQSQLDSVGLLPPTNPNPTKAELYNAVASITKEDTKENRDMFQYVLGVDYIDEATNYTGGLRKELEGGEGEKSGVGLIIFEGIIRLGEQVFGYLSLQEQSEIAAANAAAAEAYADATTTLGIPNNVFIAIVAVLGLVIVFTLIRARR